MAFHQKNAQFLPDQFLQGLEFAQESRALAEACLSSHPLMPGNSEEAPDVGIPSTSESAESFSSSSVVTTVTSSVESSSSQEEEGSTSVADLEPKDVLVVDLDENVGLLVNFLLLKYQMNELITKADMLKIVSKEYEDHFTEIFLKASMRMEIVFGLDVKEVDPIKHCYAILIKLGLTYDGMLHDKKGMPKTGILIFILAAIFMKGNRSTEEQMWQVLRAMGLYSSKKHHIFGDPRKLITKYFVEEEYLIYQQVPNSDPAQFEFLWGPRAHAETTKMQVLEFMAKVHGIDPTCFPSQYEDALRDEEERVQARILASAVSTSLSIPSSLAKSGRSSPSEGSQG